MSLPCSIFNIPVVGSLHLWKHTQGQVTINLSIQVFKWEGPVGVASMRHRSSTNWWMVHFVATAGISTRAEYFLKYSKVLLFVYNELLQVAIFPTLSGWWIDICSLKLCDSTLADRINYLYTAPGTTTFLHWLVRSSLLFLLISLLSLFIISRVSISFYLTWGYSVILYYCL